MSLPALKTKRAIEFRESKGPKDIIGVRSSVLTCHPTELRHEGILGLAVRHDQLNRYSSVATSQTLAGMTYH